MVIQWSRIRLSQIREHIHCFTLINDPLVFFYFSIDQTLDYDKIFTGQSQMYLPHLKNTSLNYMFKLGIHKWSMIIVNVFPSFYACGQRRDSHSELMIVKFKFSRV